MKIDLQNLKMYLSAEIGCWSMPCDECKRKYNTNKCNKCPTDYDDYIQTAQDAVKAITEYLNAQSLREVSFDEFIQMLNS